VIDRMFDPQDPDWYDREFIADVARRHAGTVLITSSLQAPADLPVDVVVGHMLEPVSNPRYELHRGLAWAPVDPAAAAFRNDAREYPEQIRRVLVAFGNWHDPAGLFLALDGFSLAGGDAEIQVLLPPVLRSFENEVRRRGRDLRLKVLADVPSVLPLLRDCDLLVGSYGNLTFEALALGVPVVVIAIKPFMARYAERLAAQDCLVCADEVGWLEATALAGELRRLDAARRELLGRNGRRLVDGAGLRRVARLLRQHLESRVASAVHSPAAGIPDSPRFQPRP
jgi:spore coat polysaccharide biosynthesis predicted glycosyltransferase SpsG